MAELFRLVNYCNLPIYIYTYLLYLSINCLSIAGQAEIIQVNPASERPDLPLNLLDSTCFKMLDFLKEMVDGEMVV